MFQKPQVGAGVTMAICMAFSVFAAKYLNFGQEWYVVFAVVNAMGLGLTYLVYQFAYKVQERIDTGKLTSGLGGGSGGGSGPAAGAGGGGPIDAGVEQLVKEADQKITQSNVAQGGTIANLPVIFVVGDRGSAKTSTMVYSGLEPELLAGNVYAEGNMIAPSNVNVWFAKGSVFSEVGGPVFANPQGWTQLVKKFKPGAWKSLIGKGQQAPRGVLLCFDIESFGQPNAADNIAAAARYIQARLADMSQTLGISFPVYVLFTRTDRVPFFTEFVRNLSNEEATQVFGTTLAIRDLTRGVYAEEETRRLTEAFNDLFYSLADKRLVLLPREGDSTKTPQPYEFPREFRKLRQALVQFLVDVCRPSQLRASPFLRGFYFSGVRPIVVSDAPIVMRQDNRPEDLMREAGAATQMFRMGKLQEERQRQSMAQQSQSGRRVPQWVFLGHLFNGILLNDQAAMGASGSSVKTSGLQRVLLGLLTIFSLVAAGLFTMSYFKNRSLENRAIEAAQGAPAAKVLPYCTFPALDQLKQLETLRQSLEELTRYKKDGRPWSMGLGLYAGDDLLPLVREAYYTRFHALLLNNTQEGLVKFMRASGGRAPGATDDYDTAYNTVRAHLMTTDQFQRVNVAKEVDFLSSNLHKRWRIGTNGPGPVNEASACATPVDSESDALARKQFNFYAADLANGNPYGFYKDRNGTTPPAQKYLRDFGGEQAYLASLLSSADAKGKPTTYNDWLGDRDNVLAPTVVRYGFTKEGYAFCNGRINAGLEGETWVLGESGAPIDKEELKRRVRTLYHSEYVRTWREVVTKAAFKRYENLGDASARLEKITGNRAPVPALIWWVARNTKIGVPAEVDSKFAAAQLLAPDTNQEVFIQAPLNNYNMVLNTLKGSIDASESMEPKAKGEQLRSARLRGEEAARSAVASLPVDKEAALDKKIALLVKAPTDIPAPVVAGPGDVFNKFCPDYNLLISKFPFNRDTKRPDLSVADLQKVFKPQTGLLYEQLLKGLTEFVDCTPAGCTAKTDVVKPASPVQVDFLNKALRFSKALFPEGSDAPRYTFELTPRSDFYDRFTFNISGDRSDVRSGGKSKKYVWNGNSGYQFEVGITLKGDSTSQGTGGINDGPWAVYRFLYGQADQAAGGTFTFFIKTGNPPTPVKAPDGRPLNFQLTIDSSVPITELRDMLSRCPK